MDLLIEGFKLMIIGMGTVFLFLGIMVVMITINAKLIKPFEHLLESKAVASIAPKLAKPAIPTHSSTDSGELTAVIAMAIHKYKSEHK